MEPSQATDRGNQRRWVGGAALVMAAVMLVAGETALKGKLSPVSLLVYWIICVLLTGVAILAAFFDLRAVAERSRKEQRELIESTMKDIVKDVRQRPPGPSRSSEP